MNNKFGKNELLEMINSRLTKLTEEEILELITEELNKENAQVDMDYIDVCYDLLEIKRNNEINNTAETVKIKTKRSIKVLLIAAVFVIITVSTFAVSAQVLNFNIPQKIAELINGNAEIDYNLENADTTADGYALLDTNLAKELANYGITPVTFPEEMVTENCNIHEIENRTIDGNISKNIYMYFEYNGCYGNLLITQFTENIDWVGERSVMDVDSGQTLQVNGMDILIFEQTDGCTIQYKDNLTEYNINIESNLDIALKLAESIK